MLKTHGYFKAFLLVALSLGSFDAFAQTVNRPQVLDEIKELRRELKAREEAYLAPSEQDRAAFAEFLKQHDTGLIRLLPREKFDEKGSITMRGGGAYYSFTRLTHEYGYGSDIELQMNRLSVGFAGADYGMMAKINVASLNDVTLESPITRFLAEYRPPVEEPEARTEHRRLWEGISGDSTVYKSSAPLEAGAAYLLRSICYGETDVLVAMQVVRKDTDGSAVIAWKMLKKYPKPELKRAN